MKKYVLVLLTVLICASSVNFACAKSASDTSLTSAIKMYKAGNYSQCYTALTTLVEKDPSNAVAYYYLAMSSAQMGKKDEAVENYEKVLTLSPNNKLGRYAQKGKTCLTDPEKCNEVAPDDEFDSFVRGRYGNGLSKEVNSEYEKQKIENMMREMNRKNDIAPQKFREYKDFSGEVPTNDEIVAALRVLQRAGLSNMAMNNNNYYDLSILTGAQDSSNSAMLNMLMGNGTSSLSPQLIQSLLTNQMSASF